MNSLSQLNTASAVLVSYTDLRASKVTFDRLTPTNQSSSFTTGGTSTVVAGINIISIVNPSIESVYFQVDVSATTGATVTWATLPSGYTVTNIGTGVYRISNIQTAADWTVIKNAVIHSPTNYNQTFAYTCYIGYESTKTVSWTTTVQITQRASLTSHFTEYANGGYLFGITGIATESSQFSVYCRPQPWTKAQASISSSSLLSALGGYLQRQSAQLSSNASIQIQGQRVKVFSSSLTTTSTITVNAIKLKRATSSMTTNANIITSARRLRSLTSNQTSLFASNLFASQKPNTVTTTNSALVYPKSQSSFADCPIVGQRDIWSVSYSSYGIIAQGFTSNLYSSNFVNPRVYTVSGSTWTQQAVLTPTTGNFYEPLATMSSDGVWAAVYHTEYPGNSFWDNAKGLWIYQRSGSTWTNTQQITVDTYPGFSTPSMSSDGNYLAVVHNNTTSTGYAGKVSIYVRSGSTWSLQQTLTNASEQICSINSDGTYLVCSYGNVLNVYSRSGSTWSLQQTLTTTRDNSYNFDACFINSAGNIIIATNATTGLTNQSAFIWSRVGSNWTLDNIINGLNTVSSFPHGFDSSGNIILSNSTSSYNSGSATYTYTQSYNKYTPL